MHMIWPVLGWILFLLNVGPADAKELGIYQGSGPGKTNLDSGVGVNLAEPASWQPDLLFVDQALKGRKWIAHNCAGSAWDNGNKILTDGEGWVTGVPSGTCPGMLLLDAPTTPLGVYVLIWEGEGTLAAQLGPSAGLKCSSVNCRQSGDGGLEVQSKGAGPHRATFELKTQGTTITDLRIQRFNSKLYIKNIRVIAPGGLTGLSPGKLNYGSFCKTARGPFDSNNLQMTVKPGPGESCHDFVDIYWDRFKDSLSTIQAPKVLLHPITLTGLQSFRLIRAMDWMHTDRAEIQHWSERTTYRHANQTESEHGIAFEYLVAMANALGADLWVNIPHRADDPYLHELAAFMRDNLHRELKVYVEYSNEIWNDIYKQAGWVQSIGTSQQLSADAFEARMRCQSERAVDVAKAFRTEFGTDSKRLVNVLAGQAANAHTGRMLLKWKEAARQFDAYAIAPYFGGDLGSNAAVAGHNLPQVFEYLAGPALTQVQGWIKDNISMLKEVESTKPVRLITYEAGQHLVGVGPLQDDKNMMDLFVSANRDQRMNPIMSRYLTMLRAEGINEICYLSYVTQYGKFGSWGARESESDSYAPKWRALTAFNQAQPCWWNNCKRLVVSQNAGGNERSLGVVSRPKAVALPRIQRLKPTRQAR